MIFAFLSRRLRAWLLFSLLLPVIGRLLQAAGARLTDRKPRVGKALTSAGDVVRRPAYAPWSRSPGAWEILQRGGSDVLPLWAWLRPGYRQTRGAEHRQGRGTCRTTKLLQPERPSCPV